MDTKTMDHIQKKEYRTYDYQLYLYWTDACLKRLERL